MTTTTTPSIDERQLLAAITRNPDEDSVRLAYADWLDEAAGELTPRGEFIRVQCELERRPLGWGLCGPGEKHEPWCAGSDKSRHACNAHGHRGDQLRARDRTLRERYLSEWLPPCPVCGVDTPDALVRFGFVGGEHCSLCNDTRHIGDIRRGFLRRVEVPRLSDVLELIEAPCSHCLGGNKTVERDPKGRSVRSVRCDKCDGHGMVSDWLPTPWARDLFTLHPHWSAGLVEVMPMDREPHRVGERIGYGWCRESCDMPDSGHFSPARIPDCVYEKLKGGRMMYPPSGAWYCYPTTDDAKASLAVAVCAVLRAKVEAEGCAELT